jgi:MscS family membrane protein
MRQAPLLLAVLLGCLLGATATAAPPEPDCSNPKSAAGSMLAWLQPDTYDPTRAHTCLDLRPGENGERLAVQLKQVLEARGHFVPVATLPTSPDTTDAEGEHTVVPLPETFPQLVLERADDGRWLYARSTLDQLPALYAATFSPLSQWFQSNLPSMFFNHLFSLLLWQWTYAALLLVVAFAAGRLVQFVLKTQLRHLGEGAGLTLPDREYDRTRWPLVALTTALIVAWGIPDLQLSVGASHTVSTAAWLIVGLMIVVTASRLVNLVAAYAAARAAATETKLDDQVIPLVRQATQVIVFALGVLLVLQNWGVDVAGLIAGLGIGGLAFALAAKDTIANVFGSLNIFLDKPFQIGDWIIVGGVEGTVEEVGFRSTRVRTFYDSLVTIPNNVITNANVDNMGLRHRRRVKVTIGVTYDTPVDTLHAFVEGIRGILAAHPAVQRSYEVHFNNFGPSSLDILLYYHIEAPTWSEELQARGQNFMEIMRLAEALGVSFAFPSQSLYVESTPDKPLQPRPRPPVQELEQVAAAFGPGGSKGRPGGPEWSQSFTVGARTLRGDD